MTTRSSTPSPSCSSTCRRALRPIRSAVPPAVAVEQRRQPRRRQPNADVRAETAWDNGRGSGIRVAVIDNGFDVDHPDLTAASTTPRPTSPAEPNGDAELKRDRSGIPRRGSRHLLRRHGRRSSRQCAAAAAAPRRNRTLIAHRLSERPGRLAGDARTRRRVRCADPSQETGRCGPDRRRRHCLQPWAEQFAAGRSPRCWTTRSPSRRRRGAAARASPSSGPSTTRRIRSPTTRSARIRRRLRSGARRATTGRTGRRSGPSSTSWPPVWTSSARRPAATTAPRPAPASPRPARPAWRRWWSPPKPEATADEVRQILERHLRQDRRRHLRRGASRQVRLRPHQRREGGRRGAGRASRRHAGRGRRPATDRTGRARTAVADRAGQRRVPLDGAVDRQAVKLAERDRARAGRLARRRPCRLRGGHRADPRSRDARRRPQRRRPPLASATVVYDIAPALPDQSRSPTRSPLGRKTGIKFQKRQNGEGLRPLSTRCRLQFGRRQDRRRAVRHPGVELPDRQRHPRDRPRRRPLARAEPRGPRHAR